MSIRDADRTGVLIVRLWIEGNAHEGFRARITHTLDSASRERAIAATADPEDVYAVVRAWVEAFVEQDRTAGGSEPDNHPVTLA